MNPPSEESLAMDIDALKLKSINSCNDAMNKLSNVNHNSVYDFSSSDDDDDLDGCKFDSDDEMAELEKVLCFFCTDIFDGCQNCMNHLKKDHQFDMIQYCIEKKVDQMDYIKLVNYMRKTKKKFEGDLRELTDEYMKPELEDDAFLCFG